MGKVSVGDWSKQRTAINHVGTDRQAIGESNET